MNASRGQSMMLSSALLSAFTLFATPQVAHAISPLPDVTQCASTTTGPCVKVTNANTTSATAAGLIGISGTSASTGVGTGVYGQSGNGNGVSGYSLSGVGVFAGSQAGDAVHAVAAAGGNGVTGTNASTLGGGFGVFGSSSTNDGVQGVTTSASKSGVSGLASATGGGGYGVFGYATGAGTGVEGFNTNTSGYAGHFDGNVLATGTITPGSSDARLKKNVTPLEGGLEKLLQLRGVTYEWKAPAEHGNQVGLQRGFIAQDVEKILPEWIGTDSHGFKTISIPGRALEALMVESIRTLKAQNDDLALQLKALQQERRPVMSSVLSGWGGRGMALGLLPVGIVVALRRKSRKV